MMYVGLMHRLVPVKACSDFLVKYTKASKSLQEFGYMFNDCRGLENVLNKFERAHNII